MSRTQHGRKSPIKVGTKVKVHGGYDGVVIEDRGLLGARGQRVFRIRLDKPSLHDVSEAGEVELPIDMLRRA